MKVQDIRSDEERSVLTALIVHDQVLGKVYSKTGKDRNPFENKWANLIGGWCFQYYEKYHRAPKHHIQNLFAKYAEKSKDEDAVELVEKFLGRLSKDYTKLSDELNEKYVADLASNYFERIKLGRTAEEIQLAIEGKDLEAARNAYKEHKTVDFSNRRFINPFAKEEVKDTFRFYEEDRSLIEFPGALNEFLSPHFEREGFISFIAPEKRGKSYWLLEVIYQGLRNRRKVLVYVIGDMSADQWKRRLYSRVTRRPFRTQTLRVPKAMRIIDGEARLKFRNKLREKLTQAEVFRAEETLRQQMAFNEIPLRVQTCGASIVSASDIERDVQECAQEGWVPDMVVVDYVVLLAPEVGSKQMDYRHQVNESWKVLRRISLDGHLLMVTATQAAGTAYDGFLIRKKDFSEDKRKNAHVTGMLGINQTSDEKPDGIYRLNWLFLRDGNWADNETVWTAGNLSIGCPCMVSAM